MIGWKVEISYPEEGFAVHETKYIHYESVDDELDAVEKRIDKILSTSKGVSVSIEDIDDPNDSVKCNFSGDNAQIFRQSLNNSAVSSESAKCILEEEYDEMRRKAGEMCEIGMC